MYLLGGGLNRIYLLSQILVFFYDCSQCAELFLHGLLHLPRFGVGGRRPIVVFLVGGVDGALVGRLVNLSDIGLAPWG